MTDDPRPKIFAAIEEALGGGPPVAVATVTTTGELGLTVGAKLLIRRTGERLGAIDGATCDALVAVAAEEAFAAFPRIEVQTLYLHLDGGVANRRSQARPGDAQVLLQLYESPARLFIVGGGHVGLALARVGELTGFNIVVLDDREEFANRERFPMAEAVLCGDVEAEIDGMHIDGQTYCVLVSRGHQVDEAALRRIVGRGAAYVGMIGSRRRTQTVLRHLEEDGIPTDQLARVYTPIGLDIGAETPEEIAISIIAEIVLLRRGGTGRILSSLEHRRQS